MLTWLLRPLPMLLIPILLSFLAWVIPGESALLRGFGERAELTGGGILLLGCWYGLCATLLAVGVAMGKHMKPLAGLDWNPADQRFESRFLTILTILATVGVGFVVINVGGLNTILDSFQATDANSLKSATGGEAGLSTLRYTTVVTAPFALHRLLHYRRGLLVAAWNAVLLVLNAGFASRLSLLMAAIVFLYLIVRRPTGRGISVRWGIVGGAVLIGLLTLFNYVRNARYYAMSNIVDPFQMNLYQILTYLGTPFQVSIGVAGAVGDGAEFSPAQSPWTVLVPSFFRDGGAGNGERGAGRYSYVVDVNASLTTNSAFADTLVGYGTLGLILSALLFIAAGFLYGHFSQYRSAVVMVAGVALYAVAEYWRILIFNQGVFVYTVIAVVLAAAAVAAFTPARADRLVSPSAVG